MQNDKTKINPYDKKDYYMLSLDPIHVGSGGYKLGRVDLSVVRDPVTKIPKIPATSLLGTARAYTAMQTEKYPSCAGRGGAGGEKHCGNNDCPVCTAFGFSKGSGGSFQGLAQFFDAQIVLFPVSSMQGPVWVTCMDALGEIEDFESNTFYPLKGDCKNDKLNFGWLMLKKENEKTKIKLIDSIKLLEEIHYSNIKNNTYLVSNKLFGHIVNSNLEVRTSVSIDPATGAAEDKALFTYEAIPRATILKFSIVYNNPAFLKFKIAGQEIDLSTEKTKENVENGLELYEIFGVGGMNTRGMGRVKVLNIADKEGKKNVG